MKSLDPLKLHERVMLTYAWDGVPLPQEHGFPLRIYIPDIYGMKQPKWIESIEVMDHWEPGFWVDRGWDKDARMKATSVIDTVAVDMTIINADHRRLVPIGGIAHAGAREISKVELQVDDGPWQEAALRTPLSHLTWVVWRYEWPFGHGKHPLACVATRAMVHPKLPRKVLSNQVALQGFTIKLRCSKDPSAVHCAAFIYVSHCREKWKFSTD